MPGEIKLLIIKDENGLWYARLPKILSSGYIAVAATLPTCLRRAATKLTKLGVK